MVCLVSRCSWAIGKVSLQYKQQFYFIIFFAIFRLQSKYVRNSTEALDKYRNRLYICKRRALIAYENNMVLDQSSLSLIKSIIYVVRDLFPAGPISVIFVLYVSISCNCDFSSQIDFWSRLWIPPQIFWWIHICKINNRGVTTTTGREMAKTTLTNG